MILSITSLELKKPYYIVPVSLNALFIIFQLKFKSKCVAFKTDGMGFTSYTMTLWRNEKDMKDFDNSGAHKRAKLNAVKYAKKIKTIRIDGDSLISWPEAISHLSRI